MKARFVGMVLVLVAMSSQSCNREDVVAPLGPSGPPLRVDQVLATNATIRFVDMEGGCWALVTIAGKYEPVGLPVEFRKDNLAVYAVVHGANNVGSVCQMAPLVTIDSIRLIR